MVIVASGIAHGCVGTTDSCKMVTILQIIGQQRLNSVLL